MPMHPVDLAHASRLINHGPTVLVTTAHGGRRTVMAAAWSMPVEFTPPRIAVVIDKSTFTRELIMASGMFGVCIPGAALAQATYAAGTLSGHDVPDKLEHLGLSDATRAGPILGLPVIEHGCCAWLECRRIPEPHTEHAYDTCFGEVVSAAADPRVFRDGRWSFTLDNTELHTLHHLGAGRFAVAGQVLQASASPAVHSPDPAR